MKRHRNYFKSKRLSVAHKVRIYRTYVEPILLYNSETWALTTTMEKRLDSFHRKLLRISLNYIYPKTISNEKLYTLTKEVPISSKIKKRRLSLLGHILRLHPETPVQKALEHYLTPLPRPVGRPSLTWIALIRKDLKQHNSTPPNKYTTHKRVPGPTETYSRRPVSLEEGNIRKYGEESLESSHQSVK